jgi:glycosyltransferase involved in cell wall biosynthesis
MRVWLVNHYALPPSETGGTRHYALARYLIRRGHEVTIIASSVNHATRTQRNCIRGKMYEFEQFDEVPFLRLRVPGYHNNVTRLWNMLVFALELWVGLGTRKLRRPDVVIGSSLTLFAALAAKQLARRKGVPFILEIRDLWPQTLIDMGMRPHHPAVMMFGLIERHLYRNADKIVTLLPYAAEHMVPKGARAADISWIPNGVDLDFMPFPRPPQPHDVFTVLYTGSHGLADTLDTVLDAAAILHQKAPGRFQFRFIGDGPHKERLRHRAKDENLGNVVFADAVPKQEVFALLQEADAFIISAKKIGLYRYGMSPNKLHEYMAAGRPTIFAGDSNNNPIAEASAGIAVAPEDPEAIAQALVNLASMPVEDRWKMGLRGRQYVEQHHDFALLAQRLEKVISSALERFENRRNETPEVRVDSTAA